MTLMWAVGKHDVKRADPARFVRFFVHQIESGLLQDQRYPNVPFNVGVDLSEVSVASLDPEMYKVLQPILAKNYPKLRKTLFVFPVSWWMQLCWDSMIEPLLRTLQPDINDKVLPASLPLSLFSSLPCSMLQGELCRPVSSSSCELVCRLCNLQLTSKWPNKQIVPLAGDWKHKLRERYDDSEIEPAYGGSLDVSARQPTLLRRYDHVRRSCSQDHEGGEEVGSAPLTWKPLSAVSTSGLVETDADCVSVDSFHSACEFPPAGGSASEDWLLQQPAQGKQDTDETECGLEPPPLLRDLSEAVTEPSDEQSEEEDFECTAWKSDVKCIVDMHDEASSDKDRWGKLVPVCDDDADTSPQAALSSAQVAPVCANRRARMERIDSADDRGELHRVGEFAGAATLEGAKFFAAQSQVLAHLACSGALVAASVMKT